MARLVVLPSLQVLLRLTPWCLNWEQLACDELEVCLSMCWFSVSERSRRHGHACETVLARAWLSLKLPSPEVAEGGICFFIGFQFSFEFRTQVMIQFQFCSAKPGIAAFT